MNEKIEGLLKQPWTVPAVIGVLSFGGGVGLGYFLAKRRQKTEEYVEYEMTDQVVFDFEIEDNEDKEDTETQPVRPPKVVISEEVAVSKDILKVNDLSQLRPSMLDSQEQDVEEYVSPEPDIVVEVTDEVEWDWEEEVRNRTESAPYILHKDEFYADEKNYSQQSLAYYAVDNIMADEDEKPVYNHLNVTGPLLFGHGSGDPNVVYIRNDERRAEYEITKLDALYSVEILGLEIENNERVADLKHSRHPAKFRMD